MITIEPKNGSSVYIRSGRLRLQIIEGAGDGDVLVIYAPMSAKVETGQAIDGDTIVTIKKPSEFPTE